MLRVTVAALKGQRDVEILLENTSCRMNFIFNDVPQKYFANKANASKCTSGHGQFGLWVSFSEADHPQYCNPI